MEKQLQKFSGTTIYPRAIVSSLPYYPYWEERRGEERRGEERRGEERRGEERRVVCNPYVQTKAEVTGWLTQ